MIEVEVAVATTVNVCVAVVVIVLGVGSDGVVVAGLMATVTATAAAAVLILGGRFLELTGTRTGTVMRTSGRAAGVGGASRVLWLSADPAAGLIPIITGGVVNDDGVDL